MRKLQALVTTVLVLIFASVSAFAAPDADMEAAIQEFLSYFREEIASDPNIEYTRYDTADDRYYFSLTSFPIHQNWYEVYISDLAQDWSGYGVLDMKAGRWIIRPTNCDALYALPSARYLFVNNDFKTATSTCAYADAQGLITPVELSLSGVIIDVDDAGYITMGKREILPLHKVRFSNAVEIAPIYQLALLNEDMEFILDFVVDGSTQVSNPTRFHDELAMIRTGSTLWTGSIRYGAEGNGLCDLID